MNKVLVCFILSTLVLSSCSKSGSTPQSSNTFTVKVNGTATEFDLLSATLVRSTDTDEKRFDISGKSKDGKFLLALTVGEETDLGNGVTVGAHEVKLFNEDNPDTPEDESGIMSNAFVALAIYVGSSTVTDVFAENGTINITSCNEGSTTISGNFTITLESLTGGTDYTLSEGSFSNIQYRVLN